MLVLFFLHPNVLFVYESVFQGCICFLNYKVIQTPQEKGKQTNKQTHNSITQSECLLSQSFPYYLTSAANRLVYNDARFSHHSHSHPTLHSNKYVLYINMEILSNQLYQYLWAYYRKLTILICLIFYKDLYYVCFFCINTDKFIEPRLLGKRKCI